MGHRDRIDSVSLMRVRGRHRLPRARESPICLCRTRVAATGCQPLRTLASVPSLRAKRARGAIRTRPECPRPARPRHASESSGGPPHRAASRACQSKYGPVIRIPSRGPRLEARPRPPGRWKAAMPEGTHGAVGRRCAGTPQADRERRVDGQDGQDLDPSVARGPCRSETESKATKPG